MPIYEYQCDSCGYKFEVKQSIKEDPIETCERCGHSVRRLISSPGIMFKGSGWYITDYSDKLKPSSPGEKPESTGGDKPGPSSGMDKPATPPASTPTTSASTTGGSSTTPPSPSTASSTDK